MNLNIVNLEAEKSDCDSVQCHLMPCRIEYKGSTALAKEYFWPTIRTINEGGDDQQGRDSTGDYLRKTRAVSSVANPILVASFRGRPLQGKKLNLPDGYEGSVVSTENSKKHAKKFKSFTYWNWDEIPTNDDAVVKALQWIDVAKAIHSAPKI